jgi:hypothetical protein
MRKLSRNSSWKFLFVGHSGDCTTLGSGGKLRWFILVGHDEYETI